MKVHVKLVAKNRMDTILAHTKKRFVTTMMMNIAIVVANVNQNVCGISNVDRREESETM